MTLLILWALMVPVCLGAVWCSNRALARLQRFFDALEDDESAPR
jgi:hypothetical protein